MVVRLFTSNQCIRTCLAMCHQIAIVQSICNGRLLMRLIVLLVLPSTVPTSRHDTRIAGYTDRLIYILRYIKIRPRPTLRGRTQEPEPTTGKLVNELDITASPCHVGDSRYSSIQSTLLNHIFLTFISTCIFAHRRLAFRDIDRQSISNVHYTLPLHGQVYRQVQFFRDSNGQKNY